MAEDDPETSPHGDVLRHMAEDGLGWHAVSAEIEADADGWRVVTWPGGTDTGMDQVTS